MSQQILTPNEIRATLGLRPETAVSHIAVSAKPWSDYSEADYSVEQWHAACLIHQHQGAPTSKAQCKLPVRTPDGTLNRNGVHAAAAALAGARGGVSASPAEKATAGKALVRLYGQLNETPPPSLTHSDTVSLMAFMGNYELAHRDAAKAEGGKFNEDMVNRDNNGKFAPKAWGSAHAKDPHWLKPKQLNLLGQQLLMNNSAVVDRLTSEVTKKYGLASPVQINGHPQAEMELLKNIADHMNNDPVNALGSMSPSGTQRLIFVANPKTKNLDRRVVPVTKKGVVRHAEDVDNFLAHFGRKGMKWGQHIFTSVTGGSSRRAAAKSGGSSDSKSGDSTPASGHHTSGAESDAAKARVISAKAKKSGLDSLSNTEMQLLVNRMNLERSYAQLTSQPSRVARGRAFVNNQLQTGKSINEMIKFANSPAGNLLFSALRPAGAGRHLAGKRAKGR